MSKDLSSMSFSSKREISFDFLRLIAIAIIVLSHGSANIGWNIPGVFVLGSIGNFMFFALSGWLLGLQWQNKGRAPFGLPWVGRRVRRIYPAVFVFMVVYLAALYLSGYKPFPTRAAASNFLLLGWFDTLKGCDHLWFMSALVIFYVLLWLVSRLRFISKCGWWVAPASFSVCLGLQAAMIILHIPRAFSLSLFWIGIVFFLYGGQLLPALKGNTRLRYGVLVLAVIAFAAFDLADVCCLIPDSMVVRYWGAGISGMLLSMSVVMVATKPNWVVERLGGISYEWYLVHYPLCAGPLCLAGYIKSGVVVALGYWLGGLALAALLRFIVKRI